MIELVEEALLAVPEAERSTVRGAVLEALDVGRTRAPRPLVPESSEPLYIAHVSLNNWFRFRAVDVPLRPAVYGVVARQTDDAERSNWLGKSTFLAAIPFALYGWHPADYDDAWITKGCDSGDVRLGLSDGSVILRSKRRGESTKVRFEKGGAVLVGAEANAAIARHVGLTKDDFFASAFIRQKELSRLVTGRASETLKIVAGWLDLAPIREAWKAVLSTLDECSTDDEKHAREEREANEDVARWAEHLQLEGANLSQAARASADALATKAEEIDAAMKRLTERSRKSDEEVRQYRQAVARMATVRAKADLKDGIEEQLVAVDAAIVTHRKAVEVAKVELEAALRRLPEAVGEHDAAVVDLRTKKVLAAGAFDGHCPVAGIECPATGAINADRSRNADLLRASREWCLRAERALEPLTKAKHEAERNLARSDLALATAERDKDRLEREHVGACLAQVELSRMAEPEHPKTAVDVSDEFRELAMALARAREAEKLARKGEASISAAEVKRDKAKLERALAASAVAIFRHAAAILGPGGVQKGYAAAELAAIEAGANSILEEASAELRVAVRWGYESPTALAPACGTCGAGFAAASRAKACPRCSSARGPKLEEEVRISLTRSSGAAEDLGGLAVQVAASSWLRTSRGAAWRSCAIDEPFGALDRAHNRALGAHLATLLAGRHGFHQAFVVAHSAAAMDAMPARLVITGEPGPDGASTIAEET